MKELSKAYEPQNYEDKIYKNWEDSGFFNPDTCKKEGKCASGENFSIVLPPPNVTGTLHIGHAMMLAIEDLMVRYHRMKGDKTLWLPGTDHAAVATESKVETLLIKEKGMVKPKEELGKEKFMEEVRKFAQESHDTIVNQSKKMGASLDWEREAYTLDETRNLAVRHVFKKMYDDGLIYRGHRVINWSVKGQSTCSDDELVHVDRLAKMYYFKYTKDFPITIATTRPETKLGDTAVAVHPKGKYKEYIGKSYSLKDVGQIGHNLEIKIIGSEHVDESLGTGALGVTPAHSMVDFEMYEKQKAEANEIGFIQVIGEDGKMTVNAGKDYHDLDTLEAREKFVKYLRKNDLLEKEEEIVQSVGTSDRFKDVVEPLPKTQWFVDVNKSFKLEHSNIKNIESGSEVSLKELMQTVVKTKQIKIVPERFEKTYFHWIDNLRDWCISRQIWFGHQIPVYYDMSSEENKNGCLYFKNDTILNEDEVPALFLTFASASEMIKNNRYTWKEIKDAVIKVDASSCKKFRVCSDGNSKDFEIQDEDTLDTWFSSGLWTFSTMLSIDGEKYETLEDWVKNSPDIKDFHPNSVMETGYDILFFWVARMILMTTYTLGEVPFENVYLHGLVRDEKGRKMSKSLGNIIDPLTTIKEYGADATRLSLLIGQAPGNDSRLSLDKIAGFRNFTNKLWNISRFMLMNIEEPKKDIKKPEAKTLADEWILNRLDIDSEFVRAGIEIFNFSLAGETLRDFTWNDLANDYLEYAKIEGDKSEILNYVLNTILKLWHPFMPFVTESIWKEVYGENEMLMVEKYPVKNSQPNSKFIDGKKVRLDSYHVDIEKIFREKQKKHKMNYVQNIVLKIRNVRSENGIDPAKKIDIKISAGGKLDLIEQNLEIIKRHWTNIENLEIAEKLEKPEGWFGFVEGGVEVFVDLSGAIDKDKLKKEAENLEKYISGVEKKLGNKQFVDNAPKEVVDGEQKKMDEAKAKLEKIKEQI